MTPPFRIQSSFVFGSLFFLGSSFLVRYTICLFPVHRPALVVLYALAHFGFLVHQEFGTMLSVIALVPFPRRVSFRISLHGSPAVMGHYFFTVLLYLVIGPFVCTPSVSPTSFEIGTCNPFGFPNLQATLGWGRIFTIILWGCVGGSHASLVIIWNYVRKILESPLFGIGLAYF